MCMCDSSDRTTLQVIVMPWYSVQVLVCVCVTPPTCSDEQCSPYPCCHGDVQLRMACSVPIYVSGWVEDTVEGGGVDGREVH